MPDVSVIIPTYNRRSFLKEAVASCFAENDPLDLEVVIVDDGSTDGTREWLAQLDEPRIRPIFQEHRGAQQARNAGLETAEGEAIKFLDSDDYLYPGVLVAQWKKLTESGGNVCYGPIDIVDGKDHITGQKANPEGDDLLASIARGTVTTYPHVFLYQNEVARRESWRVKVPFHQDTAYALDIATHAPQIVRCSKKVGVHRAHRGDRITTMEKSASAVQNIRYKFDLLVRAFEKRERHANVSSTVREAIAHGLWEECHKLAPADFATFQDCWKRIRDIQPDYRPIRSYHILNWLDKICGVPVAQKLINPIRRLKIRLKKGAVQR